MASPLVGGEEGMAGCHKAAETDLEGSLGCGLDLRLSEQAGSPE